MRSAGHLILASTQAIAIFHFTAVCRAARQPSVKARRLSFTLFLARSFLFFGLSFPLLTLSMSIVAVLLSVADLLVTRLLCSPFQL